MNDGDSHLSEREMSQQRGEAQKEKLRTMLENGLNQGTLSVWTPMLEVIRNRIAVSWPMLAMMGHGCCRAWQLPELRLA
jgi:hypothetical protein